MGKGGRKHKKKGKKKKDGKDDEGGDGSESRSEHSKSHSSSASAPAPGANIVIFSKPKTIRSPEAARFLLIIIIISCIIYVISLILGILVIFVGSKILQNLDQPKLVCDCIVKEQCKVSSGSWYDDLINTAISWVVGIINSITDFGKKACRKFELFEESIQVMVAAGVIHVITGVVGLALTFLLAVKLYPLLIGCIGHTCALIAAIAAYVMQDKSDAKFYLDFAVKLYNNDVFKTLLDYVPGLNKQKIEEMGMYLKYYQTCIKTEIGLNAGATILFLFLIIFYCNFVNNRL